jgi:putative transcriptional regulator
MEMPIKFRLKELIAERERKQGGKITYRNLKEATGINLNTLTAMANNDMKMVGLQTVERLTVYFDCDICDLMVKD